MIADAESVLIFVGPPEGYLDDALQVGQRAAGIRAPRHTSLRAAGDSLKGSKAVWWHQCEYNWRADSWHAHSAPASTMQRNIFKNCRTLQRFDESVVGPIVVGRNDSYKGCRQQATLDRWQTSGERQVDADVLSHWPANLIVAGQCQDGFLVTADTAVTTGNTVYHGEKLHWYTDKGNRKRYKLVIACAGHLTYARMASQQIRDAVAALSKPIWAASRVRLKKFSAIFIRGIYTSIGKWAISTHPDCL
jgi:hypothetical protein